MTLPPTSQPPEKPGTTRIAFAVIGVIASIFGFVICLFAWKADTSSLEKLALLFAGSLTSTLGIIIGYFFGKEKG